MNEVLDEAAVENFLLLVIKGLKGLDEEIEVDPLTLEGWDEAAIENFMLLVIKELEDLDEASEVDPILELKGAFEVDTDELVAGCVVDASREELEDDNTDDEAITGIEEIFDEELDEKILDVRATELDVETEGELTELWLVI